jgi:hypothetical protein
MNSEPKNGFPVIGFVRRHTYVLSLHEDKKFDRIGYKEKARPLEDQAFY